ncbi:MAG: hypothetical protein PWQ07_1400, partial [Kosmotoga sp.]|nr:hypothetical protein [Kosmotoga sp.]
ESRSESPRKNKTLAEAVSWWSDVRRLRLATQSADGAMFEDSRIKSGIGCWILDLR